MFASNAGGLASSLAVSQAPTDTSQCMMLEDFPPGSPPPGISITGFPGQPSMDLDLVEALGDVTGVTPPTSHFPAAPPGFAESGTASGASGALNPGSAAPHFLGGRSLVFAPMYNSAPGGFGGSWLSRQADAAEEEAALMAIGASHNPESSCSPDQEQHRQYHQQSQHQQHQQQHQQYQQQHQQHQQKLPFPCHITA